MLDRKKPHFTGYLKPYRLVYIIISRMNPYTIVSTYFNNNFSEVTTNNLI